MSPLIFLYWYQIEAAVLFLRQISDSMHYPLAYFDVIFSQTRFGTDRDRFIGAEQI